MCVIDVLKNLTHSLMNISVNVLMDLLRLMEIVLLMVV